MKYFSWPIFFTNLIRNFLLNTAAIILLGLGIWKRELLYAGLAVLAVDIIWAFVKTLVTAKAFENTDNPDLLELRDRFFGDVTFGEESEADFSAEDSPEVKAVKRELGDNPTVDDVIEVFRGHCSALGPDDLMLFETGVFRDFAGPGQTDGEEKEFWFILTRQTEVNSELMQLQIRMVFTVTPGNRLMRTIKWSDSVEGDFFEFVRTTKPYSYAKNNAYSRIEVEEFPTD